MASGNIDPSSIELAREAMASNADQMGGKLGAACDAVRRQIASYVLWCNERRLPLERRRPMTKAACTAYVGAVVRQSRAEDKPGVRARVLANLLMARKRFALPIGEDVDLVDLRVRQKGKGQAKTAEDMPLRMVCFMEESSCAIHRECDQHARVVQHYDRSSYFLSCLGVRLGNFLDLRELVIEYVIGYECVTGRLDTKDGSIGCWCGFPIIGLARDIRNMVADHVRDVNARGAFPKLRKQRGGYAFAAEGAATPAFVRDRLVELGERAGYSKEKAKLLASGHGPRHIAACFGARFNWTYAARAEFGMWNEGEDEVYWDMGLQRVLKRTRPIGMTSVQRYAQPAKQQVQMRLFAAIKSAIRDTIQPEGYSDMPMRNVDLVPDSAYVESVYYRMH
jgi:hypothetical protein